MSGHASPTVERHCDVCIVGGSVAGLAAALRLGRQRRSVIVVDAGERRDRAAAHSPGDLGHEGHPSADLLAAGREEVRSHGGEVLPARAIRVEQREDGALRVELVGGHAVVAHRVLAATDIVELGPILNSGVSLVPHPGGLGEVVAAAAGLAEEDLADATHRSANETDWDHRYGDAPIWSGNPNGTLVHELTGHPPGRALDVGAGEGADALWLAEQGWQVTASDISRRALDRIAAEAERRGLEVECRHADANALDPFGSTTFDLVSAQYASIPRTHDRRAIHNLLAAVAPGGTLLVVGHDLEPMRTPVDTSTDSRPFDPDAYVRVEDVVAVLAEAPGWEIEVHEKRPRPAGSATSHHVEDVVLRARRRRS